MRWRKPLAGSSQQKPSEQLLGLLSQPGHASLHVIALPYQDIMQCLPVLACRLQSWRQRQQHQVKQHKEMNRNIQAAKDSLLKLMG